MESAVFTIDDVRKLMGLVASASTSPDDIERMLEAWVCARSGPTAAPRPRRRPPAAPADTPRRRRGRPRKNPLPEPTSSDPDLNHDEDAED